MIRFDDLDAFARGGPDQRRRAGIAGNARNALAFRLKRLRDKGAALGVSWQNVRAKEGGPAIRKAGGPNARFGPRESLQWLEYGLDAFPRWAWADAMASLRHRGHYDSEHCEETYRGIVLRTNRGTLIPGVMHGSESRSKGWQSVCGNDLAVIVSTDSPYDADDSVACARRADQMAERLAESEREYQEAASAAIESNDLAQAIKDARAETLEGLAELRRARRIAGGNAENFPHICETMKRTARGACRLISKNRKRISELRERYADSQGYQDSIA